MLFFLAMLNQNKQTNKRRKSALLNGEVLTFISTKGEILNPASCPSSHAGDWAGAWGRNPLPQAAEAVYLFVYVLILHLSSQYLSTCCVLLHSGFLNGNQWWTGRKQFCTSCNSPLNLVSLSSTCQGRFRTTAEKRNRCHWICSVLDFYNFWSLA